MIAGRHTGESGWCQVLRGASQHPGRRESTSGTARVNIRDGASTLCPGLWSGVEAAANLCGR
jgi:hypothetical protein